jgi:hypothetical protein
MNSNTLPKTILPITNKCYSSGFEFILLVVIISIILLIPLIKMIPDKISEDTNFETVYGLTIIMLALLCSSFIFMVIDNTKVSNTIKIMYVISLSMTVLFYLLKVFYNNKAEYELILNKDPQYNKNVSDIFKWSNMIGSLITFILAIIMSYQLFSIA